MTVSIRDGNGLRYPLLQRTIATAKVPAVFKDAFANFRSPEFAPALAAA